MYNCGQQCLASYDRRRRRRNFIVDGAGSEHTEQSSQKLKMPGLRPLNGSRVVSDDVFMLPTSRNSRRSRNVVWSSVWQSCSSSGCPAVLHEYFVDDTCHKCYSCEWVLLWRYSRSKVKGQRSEIRGQCHSQTKCYNCALWHSIFVPCKYTYLLTYLLIADAC